MHRNAGLRAALVALAMLGATAVAVAPARAADQAKSGTPWLGVYTQTLDDDMRDAMDLTGSGALVSRVVSGSPADRAGVEKGDVIVRFGGSAVESSEALVELVRGRQPGDNVTIEVRRGRDSRTLTARLDDRPSGGAEPRVEIERDGDDDGERRVIVRRHADGDTKAGKDGRKVKRIVVKGHGDGEDLDIEIPDVGDMPELKHLQELKGFGPGARAMFMSGGRGRLGVQVQDLNDQFGDFLGVPGGKGVLVMEVMKDTPAERAGIKAGDVITRVDGKAVEDPSDLVQTLRGSEGRVSVTVVRKGQTLDLEPTLEKAEPGEWRSSDGRSWAVPAPPRTPRTPAAPRAPRAPRIQIERERGDAAQMREELRELREELRRLREELEESKR